MNRYYWHPWFAWKIVPIAPEAGRVNSGYAWLRWIERRYHSESKPFGKWWEYRLKPLPPLSPDLPVWTIRS